MAKKSDKSILNGISSAAVAAKTGKTWEQWLKALDSNGAKKLDHKAIVRIVEEKHGLGPWWQQMITVGYEQARGLRVKHQRPDGFSVSASKTFAAPVSELFRAWTDAKRRKTWLPDPITIRKSTANRSVRITWSADDTRVEAMFFPKGHEKCQVAVEHSRLAGAAAAAKVKTFWKERLEKLATLQ
jgi:hypothetical protein